MIDFIASLTTGHAALFIAVLALIASFRANHISKKANTISVEQQNKNKRLKTLEKRTDILTEIDKQNALQGHVLAVVVEKLQLFHQKPELINKHSGEYKRLTQNLNGMQQLKSNYEKRRSVSAGVDADADLEMQEKTLAEVRRLTIHLEEDLVKEKDHLNSLKMSLNKNA